MISKNYLQAFNVTVLSVILSLQLMQYLETITDSKVGGYEGLPSYCLMCFGDPSSLPPWHVSVHGLVGLSVLLLKLLSPDI